FALLDPHCLDVDELPDADLGELAAVARALDAAEGQAGVGLDGAVDEDRAGLDLRGQVGAARRIGGPEAGAEAEAGAVGEGDRLRGVLGADDGGDRTEGLLVEGRHPRLDARQHGRLVEPAAAVPPPAARPEPRAPPASERRTWSSRMSRRSARASGPTAVRRSRGSPTVSASMRRMSAFSKRSATSSTTMKRLAAMQLCPEFTVRPCAAWSATATGSASPRTMKASEPPSSSTVFLSCRPASAATFRPAGSPPVRVTARTCSWAMSSRVREEGTRSVVITPGGQPAWRKISSIASAQPGTFEACF